MAAAFDPALNVVIVYGGRAPGDTWLDDTWTWDGNTWTQLQPSQHPVLRFVLGAFDAAIAKFVVYGVSSDYTSIQTWTWDGGWHQITTAATPPIRGGSAMAYDPASGRILLFGGDTPDNHYLGDTWAFDGGTWKQLTLTPSPSARQNHLMTSVAEGVVLFGGELNLTRLNDTWMWTGNAWQMLPTAHTPAGFGPAGGWAGITTRDGQPFLLVYGAIDGPGQTYSFSQGDWSTA